MNKGINESGRYVADCLISVSIAIVAVLVAHTIGIMNSFCIQGFAIGIAIFLLSLSYYLRRNGKEVPEKEKRLFYVTEYAWVIAFCCLLPMILLIPFFGNTLKIGNYFHIEIGYYEWRYYAIIFSAVGVIILTIVKLVKYKKCKKDKALDKVIE